MKLLVLLYALLGAWMCTAGPLVLKNDYRSPRNKERPFREKTSLIVLHTTEAHAKSALNKLSERGEAHYCVTEKGEVYRIIDRDRQAFHAGRSVWNGKEDCDEYSVGIEVVGYHDQTMPLRQLAALKELVDRLKKIYSIKDAQVVCHSHVAYGAPNTWYKKKHRGRKRCGMLFAMPSVRAKLGLKARPGYDPDVKAKRLIQADSYLNCILYGSVDTMAGFYGCGAPQIAAKPSAVVAARTPPKAPAKKTPSRPSAPPRNMTARAAAVKVPPKAPPPIQKPALIVPKTETVAAAAPQAERSWLQLLGLKGGFFKKDAKLIVPEEPVAPPPEGEVLPLPANLHVGRMGDEVKDLAALAKLPGYTRGGPVSADLSPYKIAGPAWRSASTYYYTPQGKIMTGDKIDERAVVAGTFVFYKKK